jgi:hypothetical protein
MENLKGYSLCTLGRLLVGPVAWVGFAWAGSPEVEETGEPLANGARQRLPGRLRLVDGEAGGGGGEGHQGEAGT